ncbi:MAG: hypothetical protein HN416_11850 [Nitrospina sp.]|jgi:hypothetical protein|nr:hypothetical protein [Nitrospina sp.]
MKAKRKSSNYIKFVDPFGSNVRELEALKPRKLQELLKEAMDQELYQKEVKREASDAKKLVQEREKLKNYYQLSNMTKS